MNFYPQYTLEDLRGRLPVGDFLLLYAGMLDVLDPQSTEPFRDRAARATREAAERARSRVKKRGW